ncbi:hypothetical protein J9236_04495 [Providencia rettgeri]|uniref:hypothetical protein n=1 Tax=Providencia TaxID=586 RepID=UPI001B37C3D6|nr:MULTISPECIES: hypothetical protein [Providencia]MBQ0340496.1 hypothetical protein [Providencia rettgeri]
MNRLFISLALVTCSFSAFSEVTYTLEQLQEKINNQHRPDVMLPVVIGEANNFTSLDNCVDWLENQMQPYKNGRYPYVIDSDGSMGQYNVKIYTENKRYTFGCLIAPTVNATIYEAKYQG